MGIVIALLSISLLLGNVSSETVDIPKGCTATELAYLIQLEITDDKIQILCEEQ